MNKSSKETRMGRLEKRSTFRLDSVYYKIVAGLVAILIGLIIFIIWQKSSSTDNSSDNKNPKEETVIQENNNKEEKNDDKKEQPKNEPEKEPNHENNNEEDENKSSESGNELVNPDAPLDKTHETSYEEGSSDMVAIIQLSKKATGLGEDMYPVWIGNNGPGKVQATVSNKDNSKQFVVDLQFGEGAWHVTKVEQIED